ncbi:MAG: hypothetical protein ACRD1L_02085, partial [Terriglobales bacterium]
MSADAAAALLPRAGYSASIADFCPASPQTVLGALAQNAEFEVTPEQRDAWSETIACLQPALGGLQGQVHLEFTLPRMGHRVDAVLL